MLHERTFSFQGRKSAYLNCIITALPVCLAVGLFAGKINSVLLGCLMALYFTVVGAVFIYLSHRRRQNKFLWRNVMPCYLSIQDRDLKIIETNEQFRRDFGDFEGEYCFNVYKRAEEPCPNCPVLKTFEDGAIHSSDETVVTRDGKEAEMVVTSAPWYDEDGEMIGVVEMSTNITEIKKLHRELERSRAEFKMLFDLVPCYIAVMDADYRILESNERSRKHFGSQRGAFCYEVFKCRDSMCPGCIVAKSFEDGQVHYSEEKVATRDGRAVNLVVYSKPILDDDGKVTRVMEVATDITELKQLEHQLTLIGSAVAGLAHRIKNILMGLEGGLFVVNTAFETDDKEQITQGWEMIERNVAKVSQIVKDLLYCSKRREPKFEDNVSPEEIAREVYELFRTRTETEGITLSLDVGEPSQCRLDKEGIHSLITNLVTNAIDACRFDPDEGKDGHTISINCRVDDDGATRFRIADNGSGIPDEVSSKVFEDYFSTKGTEGTGLGLLVIRRVVEEHGGKISFTSRPGEGTEFDVVIPAQSANSPVPR